MEFINQGGKDYFKFRVLRHGNRLSRSILMFLEDIYNEQYSSINRALDNVPEEYHKYIIQANALNQEKLSYLRKRILDMGGDFTRDLLSDIDNFDIDLKFIKKEPTQKE